MTSPRTSNATRRPRAASAVVATALLALPSCMDGPFERTNPFDLEAPFEIALLGIPDTLNAVGEQFRVTIDADPPLPEGILALDWDAIGPGALVSRGDGSYYVSNLAGASPSPATVRLSIGDRVIERALIIRQRVDTLALRCIAAGCDSLTGLGALAGIYASAWDASQAPINGRQAAFARGTFTVRDTMVLRRELPDNEPGSVRFSARGNGVTWVVAQVDHGLDSLRMIVRQQAAQWDFACPVSVPAGETDQLAITNVRDTRGAPMQIPTGPVTWTPGRDPYAGAVNGGGQATVTPDGRITGITPGYWYSEALVEGWPYIEGGCLVRIDVPRGGLRDGASPAPGS